MLLFQPLYMVVITRIINSAAVSDGITKSKQMFNISQHRFCRLFKGTKDYSHFSVPS